MSSNYLSNKWDQEVRVGAMTRSMMSDVKNSVKEKIEQLYADEHGDLAEDYRRGCAEWHWNVVSYFSDEELIDEYTSIIEYMYQRKIDPNKNENWKRLMRKQLPQQFIMKINNLKTQVPIIAVMDDTKKHEEVLNLWE